MARERREPCFFKVLLGDHYSQNLRIPGAFLKYFNGKITKQFHLRTPAGTWSVDTEIVDNKVYIQKGWEKFVRENDVRVHEFVVFRYTENSAFSVNMYGIDMCKKSYVMEEANEEDDSSVEILGDVPRRQRSTEDDENEFEEESDEEDETEDKEESGSEEATENEDEDHNDDSDDSSDETVNELKTRCKSPSGFQLRKSKLTTTSSNAEAQRIDTLQRANAFAAKSVYPYCVISMRRSYANGSYLNIPSYFAKRYLKEKPIRALFRTNGRTWSVKLDYPLKNARVVGGWSKFLHQCKLEENDVCIFMLTNTIKFSFDVEIFRISEAARSLPGGRQTATTQLKSNMEGRGRKKK